MVKILRLLLIVFLMASAYPHGAPAEQGSISFGLPFFPTTLSPFDGRPPKWPTGLSLVDSLPPGLSVALISRTAIWSAKTAHKFNYEYSSGASEFEATLLEGTEKGPASFDVAVVGVDATAIRLIAPKADSAPLSKHLESKARRLVKDAESDSYKRSAGEANSWYRAEKILTDLLDASPEVLRVENGRLLIFKYPSYDGPILWLIDNNFFPLAGTCTSKHIFFSVHNRLHLAYTASYCCDCGERILYVYDFSTSPPKTVYQNGKLSD